VLYFTTAQEAELAAWRIKNKVEHRQMRRAGETMSLATEAADALFPTLARAGRAVQIEHRRRRVG
jgi:hypothetical protein